MLLIYTGGTIGMGKNPATGALEPLDFNCLVDNLPEFKYLKTGIEVYQFASPIDSSDMAPRLWAHLVGIIADNYDSYDGFVILHGTDTMAYTASALSFMLENLTKPVVLTGSQLPIGQLRTDGKENLVTSIDLAASNLLRGNRSTKQNAEGFNAFESFNYPSLCDAGINFNFHHHEILKPNYEQPMVPHTALDSNITLLSIFPGIQENIIRHLIEAPELRSIVMRSYGSGNAPQHPWLMKLLKEASNRGVVVVNISQCIAGSVEMERYDTGFQLKNAGVVSGYDSTVEAALAKLMFLQGMYRDNGTVRKLMHKNIAGEISV